MDQVEVEVLGDDIERQRLFKEGDVLVLSLGVIEDQGDRLYRL